MVTLNYYHNKSEKYTEGNRNNYLHHLACKYNRHGIPEQESGSFHKEPVYRPPDGGNGFADCQCLCTYGGVQYEQAEQYPKTNAANRTAYQRVL